MQELQLINVVLESGPDDGRQPSAYSGQRGGSSGALAHIQRLVLLNSGRSDDSMRIDMLQQLAVLAPQTEQLTALTLSSWGVLDRSRTAELATTLGLLPNLRDLEVRRRP